MELGVDVFNLLFISSLMKIDLLNVVTKYLNFATFSKDLLAVSNF
jgi:hypothetical protein